MRRIWSQCREAFAQRRGAVLAMLALGALGGMVVLIAGAVAVESSSTLGFCTSCHEMQAFVYQEYKQSPHYLNSSGVRAICADCHVPHPPLRKLLRKIKATVTEVPAHFLGRIDTREKFEAERLRLAQNVWAEMKGNDSRECRACHSPEVMILASQKPRARAQHEDAKTSGETCIDCHKGIAHKKPALPEDETKAEEDEDFSL